MIAKRPETWLKDSSKVTFSTGGFERQSSGESLVSRRVIIEEDFTEQCF